ncbi:MAG TPA: DUF5655 domain-containing protein [Thermoanaerobaculia bacterium]|nr:DUF5655 domain-containing protein [Thermoanaerobaculia bacterium]
MWIHDIILAMAAEHSVEEHFERKDATVRATYDALLRVARGFGHVVEEPKKTSIHLVADTAFAGVATRRNKLVLTIKSPTEIKNPRIAKCEKLSANRWHFELHLESPKDVDADVEAWLRRAYEISRA